MNYNDFLELKEHLLKENKNLLNLAENNLYAYNPHNLFYQAGEGHINGVVYRCHLVEDWLNHYGLSQEFKKHIGVSNGVRHSLETIMEHFKDKSFLVPADVYPFYQKTLNDKAVSYTEYKTLGVSELFNDLVNADILLLTDPLKPLGRDITANEYKHIENWLAADTERLLLVDAVYLLDNTVNQVIFNLYLKTNQVIIMHSLSKAWCLPNHFGVTFFPANEMGQNLREAYKKLEKNQEKLNLAYIALNNCKNYPELLRSKLVDNKTKVNDLTDLNLETSAWNPSYMFYSPVSFQEHLDNGLLTIPASVFGGEKGSVISTLI